VFVDARLILSTDHTRVAISGERGASQDGCRHRVAPDRPKSKEYLRDSRFGIVRKGLEPKEFHPGQRDTRALGYGRG